jgi:hypothetical protein
MRPVYKSRVQGAVPVIATGLCVSLRASVRILC